MWQQFQLYQDNVGEKVPVVSLLSERFSQTAIETWNMSLQSDRIQPLSLHFKIQFLFCLGTLPSMSNTEIAILRFVIMQGNILNYVCIGHPHIIIFCSLNTFDRGSTWSGTQIIIVPKYKT